MDIPSRIKIFLESTGIQNSQFADTCGIPRPSLSQLLTGRNKKVSDEVIAKIHDAYPNLSILWLLFGEGDMLKNGNIEISEPQNEARSPVLPFETPDIEDEASDGSRFFSVPKSAQNRNYGESEESPLSRHDDIPLKRTNIDAVSDTKLSIKTDNTRRVVNIMVFYSDSSFETFVPQTVKSI